MPGALVEVELAPDEQAKEYGGHADQCRDICCQRVPQGGQMDLHGAFHLLGCETDSVRASIRHSCAAVTVDAPIQSTRRSRGCGLSAGTTKIPTSTA